jgi:hypothetical protein
VTLRSLPIGASRNHGNSANGTKCSPCGRSNQKPCIDTLVTSTSEVIVPGAADDIFVFSDKAKRFVYIDLRQAVALGKFNLWLEPELGLTAIGLHMNMHSRFFAREEKQPKTLRTKNSGTHRIQVYARLGRLAPDGA